MGGTDPLEFAAAGAFRWSHDVPMSWWGWPVGIVIGYFVLNRVLTGLMASRDPVSGAAVKWVLALHNLAISAASLALGGYLALTIFSRWSAGFTVHDMLCSPEMHHSDALQFIYWWNYMYKIWELLDTWFLIVRKKPVIFLHEYHHAATLLLTWVQLEHHSTVQWVPILLNLWTHVVMYFYYGMAAMGRYMWWKKYLTRIQISQFVLDLIACGYAYGFGILNSRGPCWPAGFCVFFFELDTLACYGSQTGAIIGVFILASYFVLFIQFYRNTYKQAGSSGARNNHERKKNE